MFVCKHNKNPAKMIPLELNIENIRLIAKRKEDENYEFRIFLKGQDSAKIDKIVHRLNEVIVEQIDCKKCGNCCKTLSPCISDSEIDILSQLDNLSRNDFVTRFVEKDKFEDSKFLKDSPCKYLRDKECIIYANRPEDCNSYPHTHKRNFISRTLGIIENYGICPIVYNVFENLKVELRFEY
jgi:Fe-S-cluster containining protein